MRRLLLFAVAALTAVPAITGCSGPNGTGRAASPAGGHSAAARAGGRPALPFPVAENRKHGTRAWRITDLGAPDAIEGYASQVSVLPGQSFRLYVSTTSPRFGVRAYRMGWYGHSNRGRLVWSSKPVRGRVQPAATLVPGVNMVTTHWRPSLTVTAAGWPPGSYLLKLGASRGPQRLVPITVRSASTAGKVVILSDVTTWQAYNTWGGYDLYAGPGGFGDRSREVTFDRPYALDGAQWFRSFDQTAIEVAEASGVPLAYETDVDLARDPGLLTGARAVISLGHDEYYSQSMRSALLTARDHGTNLAFLGANAIYRHIRFAASALGGYREIICYKIASEDPRYGQDNAATTQDWRDPPDPRPESVLTGVFYECNPVSAPYVISDPQNWIFAGTHVRKGERFAGMVGPEYDRVNTSVPFPRPLEILAHSPLTCGGVSSHADTAYYTVPSGAGVFASGTMRWVCALRGPYCGHGVTWAAAHFTKRATLNLLRAFAAGPAGRAHPARDNLAQIKPAGSLGVSPGD